MKINSDYDIIIAGGGLSGLSLAWYLAQGGYDKKVLIADSTFAPVNDKTWCFWTTKKTPFRPVVCKKWSKAYVDVLDYQDFHFLKDYSYNCIQSGDFKEYVLGALKKKKNVHFLEDDILELSSNRKKAVMITKSGDGYLADYIFQSILKPKELKKEDIKYPLKQHFLGWEIETHSGTFDAETFTIMDFDESFSPGVAFMYVLPWSDRKALLEYTIFSPEVLDKSFYKNKIRSYLRERYGLTKEDYEKGRKEFGVIPMQHQPYYPAYDHRIINLGTVAGLTKPSTGYTFMRIQDYTEQLADAMIRGEEPPLPPKSPLRFRYYDLLLLHILEKSTADSLKVFKYLFKNNRLDEIFRFLGEESTPAQDLKIMSSVPYLPFFKAIIHNPSI